MFQGYHLNYMCQCVISRRNSNIPVHIYSRSFLYIKQYNFTNLIPVSSMSHILTSMLMLLLLLLITTMKMMMSMMMMTTTMKCCWYCYCCWWWLWWCDCCT